MISRFLLLGAALALAACGPADQADLQASAPAETPTTATADATGVATTVGAEDDSEAKEARADAAKADAAVKRAADPVMRRALAGSLAAYAHKEAGLPMEPTGKKGAPASARVYAFAPVNFEIAGVPASPAGAATTAALAPSLAVSTAASPTLGGSPPRWRAAYDGVQTSCFPDTLRRALDQIAAHYNSEVLVTSGGRSRGRRGSLHRSCKAADIRVAGVSPGALAAYARNVPNVNGVGTYRWVSVTHIDVRDEKFAWRW